MNLDLNSLLGGASSGSTNSLFDPAKLLEPLMPFIIIISIASVLISALYILNVINTWRSHRATIEMRNILREMNERDKARSSSAGATDYRSTGTASNDSVGATSVSNS